jgi:predicted RNA polymerase sigma factor
VVELNRAIAVGMAEGPKAGLAMVDRLSGEPALRSYYLLPSIRGDFLTKLGRSAEARGEFLRAADLATNDRERAFLKRRADEALN